MDKKVVIAIIILAMVIAIAIYFIVRPEPEYYPEEPSKWVEGSKISVEKATGGKGYINEIGEQYRDENISTVFELEGYYKGKYFSENFVENGKVKMRITTDMKPGDGVIEGFMTEKKEGDIWVVDIFVDEDWKNQLAFTNIHWGLAYKNERPFLFNEVSKGIYHDTVIDDSDRLRDDARIRMYGIIVGDITKEDTSKKTLIKLS